MKFIANLQNGWQPYASVGVVWNVLNVSKVRANEVILPKMSVDPYVEYGVGLQRNWKDKDLPALLRPWFATGAETVSH